MRKAWATLLTKPSYLPGVLVLNHSLKCAKSKYPLVVMVVPSLSADARGILERQNILTKDIDLLQPSDKSHHIKQNDRFADTWTKLRCFELVEYDRIVLLDADMLVRQNMDELMDIRLNEGEIACAHVCACNPRKIKEYPHDWTPENCAYNNPHQPAPLAPDSPRPYHLLNSGTIVLNPSLRDSAVIKRFLMQSSLVTSFIFPDQDLLAEVFRGRWKPILWKYNALKTLSIIHKSLWNDKDVKCIHYILADKPWKSKPFNEEHHSDYDALNQWWWDAFDNMASCIRQYNPADWEYIGIYVASP